MLSVLSAIVGDEQAAKLIANPNLGKEQTLDLLFEVAGDNLDEQGKNLVKVLVENDRLPVLAEISDLFEQLKNEREGSVDVHITSAFPIDAAQEQQLAQALKAKLGKDVQITSEEDASLVGGVKIRAGDLVIDGSIKGKVARLATELGI